MTSQEQHVLDEFYKNAVMGADATSTILPKADHPDLRQELCKQLEFYQSRKEEIRSQMQQAHVQPPQVYAVVNELRRDGQFIPEEAYTCSQAAGLIAAMKGAVPCRV